MLVRSVFRCEGKARALCRRDDGRVKEFAEKKWTPGQDHAALAHPRRERFGAGGADSSLIGDFRGASRASAAITRSAGLRFCALGDGLRDPLDGHGPDFRQLDWRASATVIRYGLTSAYGQSSTGQRPSIVPVSSSGQFWEGGGSNDVTCNSGDHRPSIPARSRAGMLLACGSASAGTAPYAISSCQSRHMMTAKRKAANTS